MSYNQTPSRMNPPEQAAQASKRFLVTLLLLMGAVLACSGQNWTFTCALTDLVPIDGNADAATGTGLVVGELNESSIQGLSRAEVLMMGLPPIPPGEQFAAATLRLYLLSNTGNAGNASFGPLSLYCCPHLPNPNITVSLTDYADTNFVLVTNSVVTPTSPTGQYYEIDVTAQVAKSYEYSSEVSPVADFRLQVDGLQYSGGNHYYEFDAVSGNYRPELLVAFSLNQGFPVNPQLDFQRVNSTFVASWPTNYIGFVLESADSMAARTWETVTNQPVVINGQFQVTVKAAATQRFFRLHQQ